MIVCGNSQNVTRHSQELMRWIRDKVDSLKYKVNVAALIFIAVCNILFYESTIIDISSPFQFGATANNLAINILYKSPNSLVSWRLNTIQIRMERWGLAHHGARGFSKMVVL